MSMAIASPLTISDVPLELTPAVPPNILIVSDDSESMDWEILTQDDFNSGALFSSHLNGTGSGNQVIDRVDDGDGAADGDAVNTCAKYSRDVPGGSGDFVDGYLYIVAFPTNESIPSDATLLPNDAIIKNCYVADDDDWRARSHTFNNLYFDPNKKYDPWAGVDINGVAYGPADITNAPDNPYNPQHYIDLTSEKAGLSVAGDRINDGVGFKYYIWD